MEPMKAIKIRYCSDLHLEFYYFDKFNNKSTDQEIHDFFSGLANEIIKPISGDGNSILILAGDICEGYRCVTRYHGFFNELSKRFLEVIWVPGNHEYYGYKISDSYNNRIKISIKEQFNNVHFLNKDEMVIENNNKIVILGCTLWTNFNNANPLSMISSQNALNDYRQITMHTKEDNYRSLRANDTLGFFLEEFNFLKQNINKYTDLGIPVLVVTHHAPSFESIPDRYRGDIISDAYASNLDLTSLRKLPVAWIHGHIHDSNDYFIENMRVLSNPRGYFTEVNPEYSSKYILIKTNPELM